MWRTFKKNFCFEHWQLQLAPSSLTLWTTSKKKEGIHCEIYVSLCTDGAPAMLGARQELTARAKQVNSNVQVIHCLPHRENLAVQHLSQDILAVMLEVVAVVNFMKLSAVNSSLFEQMCVNFGSKFQHLLFYCNVRWLSPSKLLRGVVDLQTELRIFLNEKTIVMPFGSMIRSGCSKCSTKPIFLPQWTIVTHQCKAEIKISSLSPRNCLTLKKSCNSGRWN